jgi:hypothetical protein
MVEQPATPAPAASGMPMTRSAKHLPKQLILLNYKHISLNRRKLYS